MTAAVVLAIFVGAASAPVEATPCLDRLIAQIDECNSRNGLELQLCYFEAGLEYEACLARLFR